MLRQQVMAIDASVRDGRALSRSLDGHHPGQAVMDAMHGSMGGHDAAAAAAAGGMLMDTSPVLPGVGLNAHQGGVSPPNLLQPGAVQHQHQQQLMQQQHHHQQQQLMGTGGTPPMLRSVDSLSGSAANLEMAAAQAALTSGGSGGPVGALPEGMKVVPLPVPPAAAAASGGMLPGGGGSGMPAVSTSSMGPGVSGSVAGAVPFHGSVQSLQALQGGGAREGSLDISASAAAAAAAAVAAGTGAAPLPIPLPGAGAAGAARSHVQDMIAGAPSGTPGSLGTSPLGAHVKAEEVRACVWHTCALPSTAQCIVVPKQAS
jgi:hypothetical protein